MSPVVCVVHSLGEVKAQALQSQGKSHSAVLPLLRQERMHLTLRMGRRGKCLSEHSVFLSGFFLQRKNLLTHLKKQQHPNSKIHLTFPQLWKTS